MEPETKLISGWPFNHVIGGSIEFVEESFGSIGGVITDGCVFRYSIVSCGGAHKSLVHGADTVGKSYIVVLVSMRVVDFHEEPIVS